MKWSEEYLKQKEYGLATKLAQAGQEQGVKGYDCLLKKIAKQTKAALINIPRRSRGFFTNGRSPLFTSNYLK